MNLDLLRNKLAELKNQSKQRSSVWKPKPGMNTVRIVPYAANPESPFIELFFHYNIGSRPILSPVSFGRPDPIVEFAEELRQTGDKEDWKLSRQFMPSPSIFAPILVRGAEIEGIKFWRFNKTIYQELLSYILDPDCGDISDPVNGRDIEIESQTPQQAGNQYGKTSIKVKMKTSPATTDPNVLQVMKDTQVDLLESYTEPTYEELKDLLEQFLKTKDDTTESIAAALSTPAPASDDSDATPSDEEPSSAASEEVMNAFKELFNK